MKRRSPLDYAYAVGRVRSLEKFMIGRAAFREAAEAPDTGSALRILGEAGRLPEGFADVRTAAGLDAVLESEKQALSSLLADILLDAEVLEIYNREDRPDRALEAAEDFGSRFIADYLRSRIDLANIKIFLRSKYLESPAERFRNSALRGGTLPAELFVAGYDGPAGEFGTKLASTAYGLLWERALRALEERETFVVLEREIEDHGMVLLKPAKYFVFGPEPVYAFGLAKKRELALVRIVASGKIHGIPPAVLAERIGETYV